MADKCDCGQTHSPEELVEAHARVANYYKLKAVYEPFRIFLGLAILTVLYCVYMKLGIYGAIGLAAAFVGWFCYLNMEDVMNAIESLKVKIPKGDGNHGNYV
jgi:hypothetical protein